MDIIRVNGIKSDILFMLLKKRFPLHYDVISKLNGILQFIITKNGTVVSKWAIDFQQKNLHDIVYYGETKTKADVSVKMEDDDFVRMMFNKLNAQKAFMMNKLTVKGQIMHVYKLYSVWIDIGLRRSPDIPFITEIVFDNPLILGLKSESMIFEMIGNLVQSPHLCGQIDDVLYFTITKNGLIMSKWKLDFTCNKLCGVFQRQPIENEVPNEIVIEDDDFTRLVLNEITINEALTKGLIKCNPNLEGKLMKIFAIKSKL